MPPPLRGHSMTSRGRLMGNPLNWQCGAYHYFQNFMILLKVKRTNSQPYYREPPTLRHGTYFRGWMLWLISFICNQLSRKEREVKWEYKVRNMTSLGETGLNSRTYSSPKIGEEPVFGGVSVSFRHDTLVAGALWKSILWYKVKFGNKSSLWEKLMQVSNGTRQIVRRSKTWCSLLAFLTCWNGL